MMEFEKSLDNEASFEIHGKRIAYHTRMSEDMYEQNGNAFLILSHNSAAESIQGEWRNRRPIPDIDADPAAYQAGIERSDFRIKFASQFGSPRNLTTELRRKLRLVQEWFPNQEPIIDETI